LGGEGDNRGTKRDKMLICNHSSLPKKKKKTLKYLSQNKLKAIYFSNLLNILKLSLKKKESLLYKIQLLPFN